jgi:BclB C-terminal domain-containing protein
VPKSATITDLTLYFTNTAALNLLNTNIQVTGRIFVSTTPNNSFSQLGPDFNIDIPLTGVLEIGGIRSQSYHGLSLVVPEKTRLVLVVSATASGLSLVNTVVGYVSAGVMLSM